MYVYICPVGPYVSKQPTYVTIHWASFAKFQSLGTPRGHLYQHKLVAFAPQMRNFSANNNAVCAFPPNFWCPRRWSYRSNPTNTKCYGPDKLNSPTVFSVQMYEMILYGVYAFFSIGIWPLRHTAWLGCTNNVTPALKWIPYGGFSCYSYYRYSCVLCGPTTEWT